MAEKFLSIREVVEPIIGGFWGKTVEPGSGNARVVRNSDVLESGEVGPKVPERHLDEKEIKKAKLKKGDVLMTMSGNVGRVARVAEEIDSAGNPFVASNFVKILRVKKDVLPAYLFFFLKNPHFQSEIRKYTRGVAIQNLSTKVFDQKFIPNVSLKEQARIVGLLEKAEILKKKRIEVDRKTAIVIPALFNKMFGDPNENGRNWKYKTIGDVIETLTDYHANGSYQMLKKNVKLLNDPDYALMIRATNLECGNYKDDLKYISESSYSFLKKSKLFGGEIIINKIGNAGNVYLMPKLSKPVSLAMNLFMLRFTNDMNSVFVYHYLNTEFAKRKLLSKVQGAVTKTITKDAVRSIPIFIPPIKLQNKFEDFVKEIELQKEKQKESTKNIDKLFFSILSTL